MSVWLSQTVQGWSCGSIDGLLLCGYHGVWAEEITGCQGIESCQLASSRLGDQGMWPWMV